MKNELDRLAAIWRLLANDTELSVYVSASDLRHFENRTRAEGMVFLTVTLPALGKALDRSFETGCLEYPEGWLKCGDHHYPKFLSRAWETLFDAKGVGRWVVPGTGQVDPLMHAFRDDMGTAVLAIRQLTMAFYKYEQPWTADQANAVIDGFIQAEDELWSCTQGLLSGGLSELQIGERPLELYLYRAAMLIERLLAGVDPYQIHPKYGTGATACKSSPWGRWLEPRYIPKLDEVYSYSEWFYSGFEGLNASLRNSRLDLKVEASPCARVVLVPKDSRGPRLISAEPREFMYIQQGLLPAFVHAVERYPNVRRQVSIIDQSRNRELAQLASQFNNLATLDLKEASDRVSWWLVTRLFPSNWVNALSACRSEQTILPNGVEIPFTKFAPMGSACCFPVEAIVFWALANAVKPDFDRRVKILFRHGPDDMPLHPGLAYQGLSDVSVFGDDIIVPSPHVDGTVQLLEAVGLKVNHTKSYRNGPFRESCGMDSFLGNDVTPLRVKRRLKGDNINVLYQFVVLCNSISLRFGSSEPGLTLKLRELNHSFFGLRPSIHPAKGKDGAPGYVLFDYYWMRREPGETPVPDNPAKRPKAPRKDIVTGPGWYAAPVKRRMSSPSRREPHFGEPEYRILTVEALKTSRDLGWSSVLRSFLTGGERGGTDTFAFRKRVRHKLRWVRLNVSAGCIRTV